MLDLNEIITRPGITEEQRQKLIEDYWRERRIELKYFDRDPDVKHVIEEVFNSSLARKQAD